MTAKVIGAKELAAKLRGLEVKFQKKAVRKGNRAGAQILKTSLKKRVPKRTGLLKKSVATKAKTSRTGAVNTFVRIKAGKGGSPHAPLIEYGTKNMQARHPMRDAVDVDGQRAINAARDIMAVEIERIAAIGSS